MKITDQITANYGGRFDFFNSSFDHENQFSPRANIIYKPTDWTTLHAGYARYFTPPPVENTSAATGEPVQRHFERFIHYQRDNRDSVRAGRLFRRGISQKITSHFQVGVDGYYKYAKQQLDDGLFGQTLILQTVQLFARQNLRVGIHQFLHRRRIFRLWLTSPTRCAGRKLEFIAIPVRSNGSGLCEK